MSGTSNGFHSLPNSFFTLHALFFTENLFVLRGSETHMQLGSASTLREQRSCFLRRSVSFLLTILAFWGLANANGAPSQYPNSLSMTCAQAQHYIKKKWRHLGDGKRVREFHSTYCSGQPAY